LSHYDAGILQGRPALYFCIEVCYNLCKTVKELEFIKKWKDTARAAREITKKYATGEKLVIAENSLFVIEKEMNGEQYLVVDSNPKKSQRRRYKLAFADVKVEDYDITRDINIQMLLADGWDARELLREI
jgi:16S rRNA C1402 (ribose-2'-O) methylase RsmI